MWRRACKRTNISQAGNERKLNVVEHKAIIPCQCCPKENWRTQDAKNPSWSRRDLCSRPTDHEDSNLPFEMTIPASNESSELFSATQGYIVLTFLLVTEKQCKTIF